jgi:hypothetical protein
MKRKWLSKTVLVLCLLFTLVLGGCDFFAGIFDPLIGSWTGSVTLLSVTASTTYTFHADAKWDVSTAITGLPNATSSGTYIHDIKAGTLELTTTSGGSGVQAYTYAISADKKTLTITQGIFSFTYTRS